MKDEVKVRAESCFNTFRNAIDRGQRESTPLTEEQIADLENALLERYNLVNVDGLVAYLNAGKDLRL